MQDLLKQKVWMLFYIYLHFSAWLKTVMLEKSPHHTKSGPVLSYFCCYRAFFCFSLICVRGMFIVDWIQGEIQRWSLFNSFLVWVVRYVTKQTTGKCLHFGPFWQISTATITCKIREMDSFWQMKMIRGLPPITFQF